MRIPLILNSPDFPVTDAQVVFIIGMTGVGKTTSLDKLATLVPDLSILPNRRKIASRIMIPEAQKILKQDIEDVADRADRFKLTSTYSKNNPGGVLHALSQCSLPIPIQSPIIFDGIRGVTEIQAAHRTFPKASFVMLDAPTHVRLTRLSSRDDAFDNVQKTLSTNTETALKKILTPSQLQTILKQIKDGQLDEGKTLKATTIITTEQKYYQTSKCKNLLQSLPNKTMYIDTSRFTPIEVAKKIVPIIKQEYTKKSV